MQPSLAYIDAESGALLHDHRLPPALHQASIRHIAATAGDTVGVVMQYERPRANLVPLVGFHRGEGVELALPDPGEAGLHSLRQFFRPPGMRSSVPANVRAVRREWVRT